MIRIFIDKLGDGHKDLFLKIDSLPNYLKTADSYYLLDFLETSEEEIETSKLEREEILKKGILRFIDYWTERIKEIEKGHNKFMPFDLSDEYIGGLLIEKTKFGYKSIPVYTDKIHGYAVTKSNLDRQIEENKLTFINDEQVDWLISEQSLFDGLKWSRQEILK